MQRKNPSLTPRHVAIIMDGNGRWANARGLPRSAGHKAGIDALRRTVRAAADLGVEYLSIYSFSTENWQRPKTEVAFLLNLLRRFIKQDVAELHAAGVRIVVVGARNDLEPSLVQLLDHTEQLTRNNTKLKLVVAFNYGAKQELARAARTLAVAAVEGKLRPEEITVEKLEQTLDTAGMPNVDLLIRTGGEQRISNFLLWQCAYAEFVFMPLFWPEFDEAALQRAFSEYQARDRRFGGVKAEIA
ncbi:MAG: isoprenyl transferase [Aestuariivirga sp.]